MPRRRTASTAEVTANVKPNNAGNKVVAWSSDDDSVATVTPAANPATITAVGVGECTVTVTTEEGGFTDTVAVTVSEAPVSGVNATPASVDLEAPS